VQQPIQELILVELRPRGPAQQGVHAIHVAGAHLQAATGLIRSRVAIGRRGTIVLQIPPAQPGRNPLEKPRMLLAEPRQQHPNRLAKQTQTRQPSHVADNVGGIQTLPVRAQPHHVEDPFGRRLEGQTRPVVVDQPDPEVVQRLLAQMRILRHQAQRMMPQQVPFHLLQDLLVREIEHFLQDQHADEDLDRPVRPPVVLAIQRRKGLLVDQRKDLLSELIRPGPLQPARLLMRKKPAGLEEIALWIAFAKHPPRLFPEANYGRNGHRHGLTRRLYRREGPMQEHGGLAKGGFHERINIDPRTGASGPECDDFSISDKIARASTQTALASAGERCA
jgi:hypothetical protein